MSTIASLTAIIGADISGLTRGLNNAGGQIDGFGGRMRSIGTVVAGGMAIGATAIVGLGVAAASAAAGFEQTLSGIKAVSGSTADEMKSISALALQLGKDTSFSAKEAAAGIEELIKGGLTIPDVMNGAAKSMLDLAAAGDVTLPEAAEIAANAMAMFGLKGSEMAHAADLIAGAANASSLSVTDFKFSMAASGAIAATTGQSFDDLAQAIAIMGKSGIKGSDAGTSLKTMLMNLQPTTDKAKETFRDLGIITADGANQFLNANGSFKSMAEIAGVLQTATKDLTDAQKLQALETMFGSDAIRAGAILAKEGAEGFKEMAVSMGKVTAASVGAERLNNFNGSLEQLKGSLETAGIAIGLLLLPFLRQMVDALTQLVNAAMPLIDQAGPMLAVVFDQVGQALAPLMPTFAALGDLLQANLQPVLIALGATLVALVIPALYVMATAIAGIVATLATILAPIALVGLAVYGLYEAWQSNFLGIRDIVNAVLGEVVPFIGRQLSIITDWWAENMGLVQDTVETVMGWIQTAIEHTLFVIQEFWTGHGQQIMGIVRAAWNIIQTIIEMGIRNILDVIKIVMQVITGDWDGAWETIKNIGQRTWDSLNIIVGSGADIMRNILSLAWDGIKAGAQDVWDDIVGIIRGKVNEIIGLINGLIMAWNNLSFNLGGFSVDLPSVNVPGVGQIGGGHLEWPGIDIGTPDIGLIPSFATGGRVPGSPGAPMLATLHGGETVSRSGDAIDYDKLAAAMAGISIELDGQAVARIVTTRQGHLVRL